jgi:hypothetical protein
LGGSVGNRKRFKGPLTKKHDGSTFVVVAIEREKLILTAFPAPWSCEIKLQGKTIMLADDTRTAFGQDPLSQFLASRFLFMASESLNRWTPVASAKESSDQVNMLPCLR